MRNNIITRTDSYKLTHWNQYPEGTEAVYSYMEARNGAEHEDIMFFGLQPLLQSIAGEQVTMPKIKAAKLLADAHLGPGFFNLEGWKRILQLHNGKLPVRIKALPEGTVTRPGTALFTVESLDSELPWLTNALESLLMHAWYPTTVASVSYGVKLHLIRMLNATSDTPEAVNFMLHDFGYRGATSDQSAAIAGAAHLVNFLGTDTLIGMEMATDAYNAPLEGLGFSVPATEHSVMTSNGPSGEAKIVTDLIQKTPQGILSVVGDSYDIYGFVNKVCTDWRPLILARDGKFVVRPDSLTDRADTPEELTMQIVEKLWSNYGGEVNSKGYRVLNPKVGVLWGDGIGPAGIDRIVKSLVVNGYSAETVVYGMGGGLHQKDINRDTERFAIKCSAQKQNGVWHGVQKKPLDASKASKAGRLATVTNDEGEIVTIPEHIAANCGYADLLQTVFENGELKHEQTFTEIRERAAASL